VSLRLWIPLALVIVVVAAYLSFYLIDYTENQGSTAFQLVNDVGIIAVVIGVIAAGLVLRRATPP